MGKYLELLRDNTKSLVGDHAKGQEIPDREESELSPPSSLFSHFRENARPPNSGCRTLPGTDRSRTTKPIPLRRCGALVCSTCHVMNPSPHRADCAFPHFEPCRSRWSWLSAHGAIKCVACATPADLGLVQGWVLALETGEGDYGWRIPSEILSLLHIASGVQVH
jgi:hypothetical protein